MGINHSTEFHDPAEIPSLEEQFAKEDLSPLVEGMFVGMATLEHRPTCTVLD